MLLVTAFYVAPSYGKVTYLHSTPGGTIVAATDAAGNQLWVKRYTPFGEESAVGTVDDKGANYGYGTHELDAETGLVYAKARYYDPMVGKFYSVDPCDAGLNIYSYAQNNPFTFVDPTGCVQSWSALPRQTIGFFGSGLGIASGISLMTFGIITTASTSEFGFGMLAGPAIFGLGFTGFSISVDAMNESMHDLYNNLFSSSVHSDLDLRSETSVLLGFGEDNRYFNAGYDAASLAIGIPTGRIGVASNMFEAPGWLNKIDETDQFLNAGNSILDSASTISYSFGVNFSFDTFGQSSSYFGQQSQSVFGPNQDSFGNINIYP